MTKFRLHRIIEIKEKLIEEKEGELETALHTLNKLSADIRAVEKNIEDTYEEMTISSLSGGDFSVVKDYIAYLGDKRLLVIEEKEHVERRIFELRANLVELMKELKMLETLKSKTFKAIKKSENRKEQKDLDGMALRLGGRRV
ncbi:flagellar export protein FliJ [Syntrophorhabdus aromaticivorans]|nr:flagellar export protein FliJ [Syntrophorhabdus aromaticivorans]HBA55525.1 flagellar export protein FliJ [Syntrophorhabdus aromaticivorans]